MINKFHGEYRWLSNFWPCTIRFNGEIYPSVEHAFQAAKSQDPVVRKEIAQAPSPGSAKRMGRRVQLRPGWDSMKQGVMLALLLVKFQDPELQAKLLATGDEELVEGNTWGDTYWGCCNGVGENKLGKALMQVRKILRPSETKGFFNLDQ